ncbi:MAG: transposase, partial [Desulfobacteraceae bacterium]|nr:transposase [Desulfobacteraceae bacterium]
MARPLRIEYEGAFYHVTSRGNERRKIYYAKSDYEKFKNYLRDAQDKFGFFLHPYVFMTNHYHLLIETPEGNLNKLMHYINGSYTNYLNRRRKRSGHLFQGRYKAILIERDSYLLELSRYIHLNPVRAGIVEKPEAYEYSSYKSFISKKKEEIVHHDLILGMMSKGGRNAEKRYEAFVEKGIGENIQDPLKDVYGGSILGGKGFIKEALARLKEGVLSKEEISYRRDLQGTLGPEDIIDIISENSRVPREDLINKWGDHRNLTIHLMKKYTGMTNRQIGEFFGGLSYSAVAKIQVRFL